MPNFEVHDAKIASALNRIDRYNSKAWELQPACNARERVRSTRENDNSSDRNQIQTRERRKDRGHASSAEKKKPTDHAVTRGRDVSLRYEGGQSPENHTVVLEWCWKPPTDRSGNEPLRQVLTVIRTRCCKLHDQGPPEHLPRANDHEGRNAE